MTQIRTAFRLARREMRSGLPKFGVFLLCLLLGVAAVAGVGSVGASILAGLRGDARQLLGGDVEARLANRAATEEERRFLAGSGTLSAITTLHATARSLDGQRRSLIEVKAVDAAYPLYGHLGFSTAEALADRDGYWGAAAAPALLARLGLGLGGHIRIGEGEFVLRAVLDSEPDQGGDVFALGPKVMIAEQGLEAAGLDQPGILRAHSYRLRLPPGADPADWMAEARRRFPDSGWRLRDEAGATPAMERFIGRISLFVAIIALAVLLVGGIGAGDAVRAYLAGKVETVATLKSLGAPEGLIFRVYLLQILGLAVLATGGGLAVGAGAPFLLAGRLSSLLAVPIQAGIHPGKLLPAAAFGLLVTLLFSLPPLRRAAEIYPSPLFRDLVAPQRAGRGESLLTGALLLVFLGLALTAADDRRLAAGFLLGGVIVVLAFRLVATAFARAARRLRAGWAGHHPGPRLRLALAGLYRPGGPAASVIPSLGAGLTLLVTVALVEGSLLADLGEKIPASAPSHFFLNIEPGDFDAFRRLLDGIPGVSGLEREPSLRGRITRVNGVPVAEAAVAPEARWALESDRGITWSARIPGNSHVVAGAWWRPDHAGPPLISFDETLARGMGLVPGDTLTVNVLGREITARIANLRAIDWASFGINFAIVFAPGVLDGAPQTLIATARATPEAGEQLEPAVAEAFPSVTTIRVGDALAMASRILSDIAGSIRMASLVTLLAGGLVLAGAVAADSRRRRAETVMLAVLGATRGDVLFVHLTEFTLMALAAAAAAVPLGTLGADLLVTAVMHGGFVFRPRGVAEAVLPVLLLAALAGGLGGWRASRAAPAKGLREMP